MPRILFVAMVNSIHAARWISQLPTSEFDIHLFPCQTARPHPLLGDTTSHMTGLIPRGVGLLSMVAGALRMKERLGIQRVPVLFQRSYWLARTIRRLKPDLVHSLEFQHAGYLALEARRRIRRGFPPWIATNWGK